LAPAFVCHFWRVGDFFPFLRAKISGKIRDAFFFFFFLRFYFVFLGRKRYPDHNYDQVTVHVTSFHPAGPTSQPADLKKQRGEKHQKKTKKIRRVKNN
jgi:hypothetical protein